MLVKQQIYCCGCDEKVHARLTDGKEIYPHRPDLAGLPFWKCDDCQNYVGCHHKTKARTTPLGIIPTKEIMHARSHVHRILDPLWRSGKMDRKEVYAKLTKELGWKYHTANIRSVSEARQVYKTIRGLSCPQ